MSKNLYESIRERRPQTLDTVFIETPKGDTYTYADVDSHSARWANTLVARGVGPGERVLVQTDKSPEAIFFYLGCLRAGAVYVPLNTAYTMTELAYFIGDAEPKLMVCRPGDEAAIRRLETAGDTLEILSLDATGQHGSLIEQRAETTTFDERAIGRGGDDLASMLYTSGTTGRSKGAMLSHDNLAANAKTLVEAWRFSADDVLLHALPIFHTHGLFVAIHCALFSASRLLLLAKFDTDTVLERLPESTVMMGVPTFYTRLLSDERFDAERCRSMRLFISGSAPLTAQTHRQFRERCGHAILERYGMTETGMLTSNPYEGERIAGSVGPALPDVQVRVSDPDSGQPLGAGEIGVIEVKGPNVFSGYWRMPEKTAEEFRDDGFFITGDLGTIDERGYVTIVGRGKDLIISGGFNVYPKEIETALETLPGVADVAVIGLPHADFGEAVSAVVVAKPGHTLDEAELIGALGQQLAKFKTPKRILIVDELPRNAMGKIQKNQLRDRYADLYR